MPRLKEYREAKGVKQSAVAAKLGISRQTYSFYEKNQEKMTFEQAKIVCDFLGTRVSDIFLPLDVD
ncbi:helix-turn-helix transcriptional regulator [Lancefieldella rimae]|uniref:DNA-binding helix-turn-helix protein n=1 Tax=Lancefieldella rimae (strain ATCC 49626 / DSM 7090 / CCUG 31168 / NBRC 15546 / VPI D140H-11A) TaxID=553184 RepID=B9CLN1_LANR4|nr:helix-turn-helix transcriptional regulator [Lancefieldella rimae]EEE17211.1 DNA-binding helix-turn-helix protein [Lancefieldella rimae ATCC 49626]